MSIIRKQTKKLKKIITIIIVIIIKKNNNNNNNYIYKMCAIIKSLFGRKKQHDNKYIK